MIPPSEATKRSLVYAPQWEVEYMPSCCGCHVPIRLQANYTNKRDASVILQQRIRDKYAVNALEPLDNFEFQLKVRDCCHDQMFGMSYKVAMAAVVADMLTEGPTMFICTDNVRPDLGGDVHAGPFATRNLPQFILDEDIGEVWEGIQHQSVKSWSFVLDERAAERVVIGYREDFYEGYNKVANQLPDDTFGTTRMHIRF